MKASKHKLPIIQYFHLLPHLICHQEYAMALLVEALRYKPEGCGFNSRWRHWDFSLT
jgi:hypothetical protein